MVEVEVAAPGVLIACGGVARALCSHSGCQNEKQSKDNTGEGLVRVTWPASCVGGDLCGFPEELVGGGQACWTAPLPPPNVSQTGLPCSLLVNCNLSKLFI